MARREARIFTAIWDDENFRSLPAEAQRLYFLALTQADLSFCGVLSYAAKRWGRLAQDTTSRAVNRALRTLVDERYMVMDHDTEEVLVRTFIRHDGILKSPNLILAMGRDFEKVHSPHIRATIVEGLPEGFAEGFTEGIRERIVDGLPEPLRERSRGRASALPALRSPIPVPPPQSTDASSSSSEVPQGAAPAVDDDDGSTQNPETNPAAAQVLAATWTRLALADLARLAQERPDRCPPAGRRRDGWLRTAALSRAAAHTRNARALLAEHPDLDPAKLAELLEAPAAVRRPRRRPGCDVCGSTGWAEIAGGEVIPCSACAPVPAGAR